MIIKQNYFYVIKLPASQDTPRAFSSSASYRPPNLRRGGETPFLSARAQQVRRTTRSLTERALRDGGVPDTPGWAEETM